MLVKSMPRHIFKGIKFKNMKVENRLNLLFLLCFYESIIDIEFDQLWGVDIWVVERFSLINPFKNVNIAPYISIIIVFLVVFNCI